jgi:uncharacterized sulfatase
MTDRGAHARVVLLALLLGVVACGSERPNVVLIIGDDFGWPYYGFADSPQTLTTTSGPVPVAAIVQTPNLDALAASGALFRNGYATASVCQPSMTTLLSASGLHPVQWDARRVGSEPARGDGPTDDAGVPFDRTLPAELQRSGYRSWEGGKMWGGTFRDAGFTHGLATQRRPVLFGMPGSDFGRDRWDPATCGSTGDDTPCPALDPLRDFLDEVDGEPFFVWFAPMLPHKPYDAPPEYKRPLARLGLARHEVYYLANVRWFDELVGELLRELDARRLRDDTLIVYLSDNGWGLGFQTVFGQGRGKGTPYDLGSRTPVMFSWPGRIPAGDYPDLVLASDVPATILSYARVERPPGSMGLDLRARLEGGAPAGRTEIIQHHLGDTVLARPWRFIRHADGREELYAIDVDPFEQVDRAAEHPRIVAEYRARAEAHLQALLAAPAVP